MALPRGTVLAIDPGPTVSGWVTLDSMTMRPSRAAITPNDELLDYLGHMFLVPPRAVAIEMIASYGMAVGASVFDTCVWIGRFHERIRATHELDPHLVKREPVKLHLCKTKAAKNTNVTQALVDRFAYGERNHGKGTKAQPGWFYGFSDHMWQAYALGVYTADTLNEGGQP